MNDNEIGTFKLCITVTFPVFLPFIGPSGGSLGDNPADKAMVTMPKELYERLEYATALFHEVQREVRKHVEAQDRRRWDVYDRNVPREINLDDIEEKALEDRYI